MNLYTPDITSHSKITDSLKTPADWHHYVIQLKTKTSILHVSTPARFDTLINWFDPGDCFDCPGGGHYHYRIQSKDLPVVLEKEWDASADSFFSINFTHDEFAWNHGAIKDTLRFLKENHIDIFNKISNRNSLKLAIVHGRKFLISNNIYNKYFSPPRLHICAYTIFDGRLLSITIDRWRVRENHIIRLSDAYNILSSIKIESS